MSEGAAQTAGVFMCLSSRKSGGARLGFHNFCGQGGSKGDRNTRINRTLMYKSSTMRMYCFVSNGTDVLHDQMVLVSPHWLLYMFPVRIDPKTDEENVIDLFRAVSTHNNGQFVNNRL
jgi:hypothetical protein